MRSREQLEVRQSELLRLEQALRRAEERGNCEELGKIEAKRLARQAKEDVRKAESALRMHEARAKGREEGLKDGMIKEFSQKRDSIWQKGYQRGYDEGRGAGFEQGRINGWNEGMKYGKNQGLEEGIGIGKAEEREHALAAFDRFIREEIEDQDKRHSMVQRWTTIQDTDHGSQSEYL
ncbi:hypothetical protein E1B28_000577 [Marasmius oreades]|uniref:Essential protein Yae1 N-terminal domain-containing protein n=1 Tax=Marasmius oreades TaxID=181124 RepID=A0A9P7V1K7_9AGAR|nr:uncharacterized protein E1B28_000577 [Marasmius oreades]KAG7098661.1 hypothetical protein E1B28_000577 [Marasmius oreades]